MKLRTQSSSSFSSSNSPPDTKAPRQPPSPVRVRCHELQLIGRTIFLPGLSPKSWIKAPTVSALKLVKRVVANSRRRPAPPSSAGASATPSANWMASPLSGVVRRAKQDSATNLNPKSTPPLPSASPAQVPIPVRPQQAPNPSLTVRKASSPIGVSSSFKQSLASNPYFKLTAFHLASAAPVPTFGESQRAPRCFNNADLM